MKNQQNFHPSNSSDVLRLLAKRAYGIVASLELEHPLTNVNQQRVNVSKHSKLIHKIVFMLMLLVSGLQHSYAQLGCPSIAFTLTNTDPCCYEVSLANSSECTPQLRLILDVGQFTSWTANTANGFTATLISPTEILLIHSSGIIPFGASTPISFCISAGSTSILSMLYDITCGVGESCFTDIPLMGCASLDSCMANFAYVINDDCALLGFINLSTGVEPLTYQWNFGDPGSGSANSSTLENPSHDFELCTDYLVCLTVTAADGCTHTFCYGLAIVELIPSPPVITCPTGKLVSCSNETLPSQTGFASAIDNCDTSPSVTYEDVEEGLYPCDYSILRTWTSTDQCGNSSTCLQVIGVLDEVAPVIDNCPSNITVQGVIGGNGICTANVTIISPTATDNCDPSVTLKNSFNQTSNASGIYPSGNTSVVWTATDDCHNVSTCITTVSVNCDPCETVSNSITVGLTGYFPFQGNANDFSNIGSNGTVLNATLTPGHDNAINSAYNFNGNSSIVCGGDNRNIIGEVSIAAWVRTTEMSNGQWIAGKYSFPEDRGYHLIIGSNAPNFIGQVAFNGRDGTSIYHSSGYSPTKINDGGWHCVVGTAGNGQWKVYVDGNLESTSNETTFSLAPSTNEEFTIGWHTDFAIPLWMNGDIDNVLVLNRVLSQNEIECLCTGVLPTICECPIGTTPGSEMVINGNFAGGNTGFLSDYVSLPPICSPGEYTVTDAINVSLLCNNWSCNDHTTGLPLDQFFVADGSFIPTQAAWREQVFLNPNSKYSFCAWVNNLNEPILNAVDPIVEVFLVNQSTGVSYPVTTSGALPETPDSWINISAIWYSNPVVTVPYTPFWLEFRSAATSYEGNNFAIDDISFRKCSDTPSMNKCICHSDISINHGNESYPASCFPHTGFIPSFGCTQDPIIISGFFGCADSITWDPCDESMVTWSLIDPSSNTILSGTTNNYPTWFFNPSLVGAPGLYKLVLSTFCPGSTDTCYCEVEWIQEVCDLCCTDLNSFCNAVMNVTTITSDNNACKAAVNIGNLQPCDYIAWIDWGDTNLDAGPFYSGQMPMHIYNGSGTYTISYQAIETDLTTGMDCFEKVIQQTINLVCRTCTTCENNLAQNSGFLIGAVPGALGAGGSTNNWSAAAGSPDLSPSIHDCNPMGIQMWGSSDLGEAICQTGINFQFGHTYSISFSARYTPLTPATPYVQFQCYASNGCFDPFTNCPGCEVIGTTTNISNTGWATYTIPNWTPANAPSYSTIVIKALNANAFPLLSFGHIDNICIQENDCAPPPADMVSWWRMDEQSGNVAYDYLGNHHAVQQPIGTPVQSIQGKVGDALSFSSPGGLSLKVSDHSDFNFGNNDFSIDAWIYTDMGTQTEPIVDKLGNLNTGYALSIQGTFPYYLTLVIGTGSTVQVLQGPPIEVSEWNFISVSVNSTSATFCVGNITGFTQLTVPISGSYNASNTRDLLIGNNPFNPHWGIIIDELEIFSQAVDYSEFKAIWKADSYGKCITVSTTEIVNKSTLLIYPSPNYGDFYIAMSEPIQKASVLRIIDLTGNVILESKAEIGKEIQTIHAPDIPSGMYFIQILSYNKMIGIGRFLKQ